MRGKRHALGAAALLCVAASANAGLFDDDEARRRIELLKQELSQQGRDNEARIARLEEQIRNIGVVELVRQLEQTNAEIARLRGQLEVLVNENQQLQKRQRDFYLDLDSRLKRVEGAPASGSGTSPPAAAPTTDATPATSPPRALTREEQQRELKDYDVASNLFRRNDFAAAIEEFRKFLRTYPNSQLAANAQYWIGISYANLKDYRSALAAQEQVLVKHPQSPKAPDAMLAIAALHAEQGDIGSARNTLEDIIARFPASDAAGKARTRLASLRSR